MSTIDEPTEVDPPDPVLDAALAAAAAQGMTLRELKDRYLWAIHARTGGNKSKTAKVAGISRRTVIRNLRLDEETPS